MGSFVSTTLSRNPPNEGSDATRAVPASVQSVHGRKTHESVQERVACLRERAKAMYAGIDSVREEACTALRDLDVFRQNALSGVEMDQSRDSSELDTARALIGARFLELCEEIAQIEAKKVSRLEEELVLVDAALEDLAEAHDVGKLQPLSVVDAEPREPPIIRVVRALGDDGLLRLASICAPCAIEASDVIVGALPAFALVSAPTIEGAGGMLRFSITLGDSDEPRCPEEALLALAYVARRVRVLAHNEADPSGTALHAQASVNADRFAVDVGVAIPWSFTSTAAGAIVVDGVFLHGELIRRTSVGPGAETPPHFPARIAAMPHNPLDVFSLCYLRVGRWHVGRTDDVLVLWNDQEQAPGWELGMRGSFFITDPNYPLTPVTRVSQSSGPLYPTVGIAMSLAPHKPCTGLRGIRRPVTGGLGRKIQSCEAPT